MPAVPLLRRRSRRGPGRAVAFLLDFPSPQPSPRSLLAGRGLQTLDVPMLNSTAVGQWPVLPKNEFPHSVRISVFGGVELMIMGEQEMPASVAPEGFQAQ